MLDAIFFLFHFVLFCNLVALFIFIKGNLTKHARNWYLQAQLISDTLFALLYISHYIHALHGRNFLAIELSAIFCRFNALSLNVLNVFGVFMTLIFCLDHLKVAIRPDLVPRWLTDKHPGYIITYVFWAILIIQFPVLFLVPRIYHAKTGYCFTKNDDVTAMFFEGMLIITPPFLGCALMGIIVFCLKFKFNLFSWLRTNIALENDEVNATANGHSMPSSSSSSTLRSPFTMFTIMIILGFLRFANHVMFLYFNFNRSFYSKATSGVIFVLSSVRIMRTLSHSPYLFVYFKHHLEFRQTALGLMSKFIDVERFFSSSQVQYTRTIRSQSQQVILDNENNNELSSP